MSYSSFPTGGFYPAQNTGEPFLVFSTPSSLSNYSLLQASTGISLTLGVGTATVEMDINGLTELTTIDTASDFLPVYDSSAGSIKKIKPSNLGVASTLSDLFTEVAYVALTTGSSTNPTINDSINVASATLSSNTITVTFTSAFSATPFILFAFVQKNGSTDRLILKNVTATTTTATFEIIGNSNGTTSAVTNITTSGSNSTTYYAASSSGGSPTSLIKFNYDNTVVTTTQSNLSGTSGYKVAMLIVGPVV